MNWNGKRTAALLLAACLLLGLTACNSGGEDKTQQLTGKVYVPQFLDFTLDIDYIQGGCADEENVYIIGSKDEETEETDPETGETYTTYASHYDLYRVPLDGGEAARLENYQMTQLPEGSDGDVSILKVEPGEDGTIWVTEYVYTYTFNLPDGMDMTSDERWEYQEYQESTVRRQLDGTGAEIQRVDVTDLAGALEVEYLSSSPAFDRAGNIYVCDETHVYVLDAQMNKLFTLDGENLWGEMTLLSDGTMGLLNYFNDEATETYGYRMKVIDLEAQSWGVEYDLPSNAYTAYPGGGDYLFYYANNDSIYGYKAGAEDGEKIFSWIDSDINRTDVQFFSFLSDGRVVVVTMTRDWNNDDGTATTDVELAVMTGTDRSQLPEKTDLTFATMFLGYDMRNRIIEFNKTSQLYRVNVKDYAEFNTSDDESAGLTRLNTEIVAGNVPDILDTRSMPIRQYAAKGLLEDLWPYIENDAEIGGREGVMEHVLQCSEQDGKLYQIFPYFYIQTVVGAKDIVGDRMSWTLADLRQALAKMPEGCSIFGQADTQSGVLSNVLAMNADSFVDWSTGECHFDTDQFKALLEFAGGFPAEFSWEDVGQDEYEDDYQRILNGRQMLVQTSVSDLGYGTQEYAAIFGGDVSYVGYPREDGGVGSAFVQGGTCLSISSACKDKDAAWSLVRQLLLPVTDDEETYYGGGQFYVNKKDFDKSMQDAMTPRYQEDENGNQVLDENGSPIEITMGSWWITDDVQIEIKTPTQADYDNVMALYNAVDSMSYQDEKVFEIINDEAAAYFAGDKGLDECAAQIQSRVRIYVNEQR